MSATVTAAVHLEQDFQESLRTTKNTDFEKVKQLFDISQELIVNQKNELCGMSTIEWNTIPWMGTTLPHDRAVKLSKAEVHVYSDSVLCLGKGHASSINQNYLEYRELDGIDREPVEFEWRISQDTQNCSCFVRSKGTMEGNRSNPEKFQDRIIFASMCNDIAWRRVTNQRNSHFEFRGRLRRAQEYFLKDIGHSSAQEPRKMVWDAHLQAKRFV